MGGLASSTSMAGVMHREVDGWNQEREGMPRLASLPLIAEMGAEDPECTEDPTPSTPTARNGRREEEPAQDFTSPMGAFANGLEYVISRVDALEQSREVLSQSTEAQDADLRACRGEYQKLADEFRSAIETLRGQIGEIASQVSVLMKATAAPSGGHGVESSGRVRVPEPQSYDGMRDARELQNFLFDMEQYLRAMWTSSEEEKVSIAVMYLKGDAKLWWCVKYEDMRLASVA